MFRVCFTLILVTMVLGVSSVSAKETTWKMGLGEIAKYCLAPGWHQPASFGGLMINKKAWDALDEETQIKLRLIANNIAFDGGVLRVFEDIEGFRELAKQGVQTSYLSEAHIDRAQQISNRYLEKVAAGSPLSKKIIQSWTDYRKAFAPLREAMGQFGFGFNPKEHPNIDN